TDRLVQRRFSWPIVFVGRPIGFTSPPSALRASGSEPQRPEQLQDVRVQLVQRLGAGGVGRAVVEQRVTEVAVVDEQMVVTQIETAFLPDPREIEIPLAAQTERDAVERGEL